MDRLDVKILRLLIQGQARSPLDPNFRKPYRTIARDLAVDEHTVRNRIKRFHDSGFIREWRCHPNPHLFGADAVATWFKVPDDLPKDELLGELKLLPGVYLIGRYFGDRWSVIFLAPNERLASRLVELLNRMSRAEDMVAGRVPFPSCGITLSESDRRILRSLAQHPWKSCLTVSKEVGLSTQTVRHRLERLNREGAVFAFPSLDPRAVSGSVMGSVTVTYPPERKMEIDAEIARGLDPYLWHVFHMLPYGDGDLVPCSFNLMLPNMAMAPEILRWAQKLPGVATARVEFVEEVITIYEPLDALMERGHLDRVPRESGPAPDIEPAHRVSALGSADILDSRRAASGQSYRRDAGASRST